MVQISNSSRIARQISHLLVAGLFLCLFTTLGNAAQLKSVKIIETAQVPIVQPDWPIPRDPNQVFYLQRSTNKNTIVFTAIFDASGNLRPNKPAQVYWRRFNDNGERKPLKPFERALAFGMNVHATNIAGVFNVSLKPLPQMAMQLRQTAPGKAELLGTIGGRKVRAVYAYATVDESGWIPKVTQITLHGIDLASGRALTEVFRVNGGSVRY